MAFFRRIYFFVLFIFSICSGEVVNILSDSWFSKNIQAQIDDEGNNTIGSDHNLMVITFNFEGAEQIRNKEIKERWKLDKKTDWQKFNKQLAKEMKNWDQEHDKYNRGANDITELCSKMTGWLVNAGEKSIGYKKIGGNKRILPKELYGLVKDRNNKERIWKKSRKNNTPQ